MWQKKKKREVNLLAHKAPPAQTTLSVCYLQETDITFHFISLVGYSYITEKRITEASLKNDK